MLKRAKDAYVEHLIAEENFGRNLLEGYCNSRGAHLFICFFPDVYHHMIQTARISRNGMMCISP